MKKIASSIPVDKSKNDSRKSSAKKQESTNKPQGDDVNMPRGAESDYRDALKQQKTGKNSLIKKKRKP